MSMKCSRLLISIAACILVSCLASTDEVANVTNHSGECLSQKARDLLDFFVESIDGTMPREKIKLRLIKAWKLYRTGYQKIYSTEKDSFRSFIKTVMSIIRHNRLYREGKTTFKMGLNAYSNLTPEMFISSLCGLRVPADAPQANVTFQPLGGSMPRSFDWRDQDIVTPVKDQGICASCYTFSSTGALESLHKRKTGLLVSLSEQELLDCTIPYGNNGCSGGFMDACFLYTRDNGLTSSETNPYIMKETYCPKKPGTMVVSCSGFGKVQEFNENALKEALMSIGPISVGMDGSAPGFASYRGGIFQSPVCSSTSLDHAVLLIGFGEEVVNGMSIPYWTLKNSWGTTWGDQGYFRLPRANNMCGIMTLASYPLP